MAESSLYGAKLTAFIGLEHRYHKFAQSGDQFDLNLQASLKEEVPKNQVKNTEAGLRLQVPIGPFDISLYQMRYFCDIPSLSSSAMIEGTDIPSSFVLRHNPINHTGLDISTSISRLQIYAEAARLDGFELYGQNNTVARYDGLLGLEYQSLTNHLFVLEYAQRSWFTDKLIRESVIYHDFDEQLALIYRKSMLRDRLMISLETIGYGKLFADGAIYRNKWSYQWSDELELYTLGAVYTPGAHPTFQEWQKNDQILVGFKGVFR